MTSELAIMEKIRSIIVSNYANYKNPDDDTVITNNDVMVDICDPDRMKSNVGIWIDARSITVDDYTTDEDSLSLSIRLSIICKREESTILRNRIFNIKSALYRILRNNQSLDQMVDLITIDSYNYYPQLFLEIGIVGMDIDCTVDYTEQW